MAQRFGGKFSPSGAQSDAKPGGKSQPHPYQGKQPTRLGGRVNMLFVLPFFFVIAALFSSGVTMGANLAAFGLLILSAWLTREGLRAQVAYEARTVAKRPAIPRKAFGAVAMAVGITLPAALDGGPLTGLLLGGLAGALHLASFGMDPLKDKGIEAGDIQSNRVARAVEGAESELSAMLAAIEGLKDRQLLARVERFQITAREMFRTVEQDPRDLTAARKYLGVYLTGAREASQKFAALYGRTRDAEARSRYEALLDDLETNFAAKTETLLLDDRSDLDIEVDVLRERLERETLTLSRSDQT